MKLRERAITKLGSVTGISIATGAGGTIYRTPAGKITRITHVVFRNPSGNAGAATNLSITQFYQNFSLANLVTANTGYVVVQPIPAAAPVQFTEIAGDTNVVLTVTTGAAGVTADVDVFGFQADT